MSSKAFVVLGGKCVAICMGLTIHTLYAQDGYPGVEVIKVIGNPNLIGNKQGVDDCDVKVKQANDLEDLFNEQPNMTVGGGFGHAQKLYVRGIEDTNLNISIDGATQSSQLFQHQGRLAIEPELLKQVEIKAGTGTALDGFGALGGAINFVTKNADDLLSYDERFGALVKTSYYSNTDGYKLSSNFYGKLSENWSTLVFLGKHDSNEITDGHGTKVKNTHSNQEIGLFKLSGEVTDNQWLSVSHDIRQDDGLKNLRSHFQHGAWNKAVYQQSKRTTTSLNYELDPAGDWLEIKVNAYNTNNEFSFTDNGNYDGGKIRTYGLDLRNTSYFDEHEIVHGLAYQNDQSNRYLTGTREEGEIHGIYVQDFWELTPDMLVSFGLRYDYYQFDDANSQHFSAKGLSPNISAKYQLNDDWTMGLGYTTALRGQKSRQVMAIGDVTNSPSLKEEKAQNIEFNLEYLSDLLNAKAAVFYNKIDDVVSSVGAPMTVQQITNIGELKTKGFNISVYKNWDRLDIRGSFSKTEPEINGVALNDNHFGLGTSFGDTFTIGMNYQFPDYRIKIGWLGKYVKELTVAQPYYPNKASYNTHDLYLEWDFLSDESVSLNITASNVFDSFYYDHGTFGYDPDSQQHLGLPEPGRDIRLSISAKL